MRKLELKEFLKYRFLSGIELSPDGKWLGYAVHLPNLDENKYDSNLWLYATETGSCFQLTGMNKETGFQWLPDSKHVMFSALREEQDKKKAEQGEKLTQYYKINIQGGEAQKFFSLPYQVVGIKVVSDSEFVFAARKHNQEVDLEQLSPEEKAAELKKRKEERDYEVLDEIPFWFNGAGYTNQKRTGLYYYDLNTQQVKTIYHDAAATVTHFRLNQSKTKVVFAANAREGKASLYESLHVYDLKTGELSTVLEAGRYSCTFYADFTETDQILFLGTDMNRYGINENDRLYQIDPASKEITCITPQLDMAVYSSVGSDCRYGGGNSFVREGNQLYLITTQKNSSHLTRIGLETGEVALLTVQEGSVDGFTLLKDSIYFIGMRGLKLQEIYGLNLENQEETQLTTHNQWLQEEVSLSPLEPLTVEVEPGLQIHGWVIKPVGFDPEKQYPAILDIHGGPKTVYGEVLYHEMQHWANEGYFVFFCNPRGSDGRGNVFADIRGKYGTIDYEDLLFFTDQVLAAYPQIDPGRLGVAGGSYGGFMVNWIIGHTHRFRAAVSQRSISNWISKFGTTDIGYFFAEDQQGATPWRDQEKLWYHSPLRYADQAKTPTLFIHSDEDYRCWITEAYQMFTALKYHGVEARLCIFRGENHELSRSGKPKHRVRRLEEMVQWFDQHLKG